MAIPSASLPGFGRVKERVEAALGRCQEAEDIEFKRSAPWDEIKWKIVHTSLGMANLRDGGIIIVGVSEDLETWTLTGINGDDLATYDNDDVVTTINVYASPFIDVDVVTVDYEERTFLAINVREFRETPVVCKKSRDDTALQRGSVYIRPPGLARTTKVTDARELHDLLELAAEKRARRLIEAARRAGYVAPPGDDLGRYDEELGDL
jgi:predicted HTH transcriptional regulator